MSNSSTESATFGTQANALLRKNLTFQKRNMKTNCCLCCFPTGLLMVMFLIQLGVNHGLKDSSKPCGCKCVDTGNGGPCEQKCGIEYSDGVEVLSCPIPHPPVWLPLLRVPAQEFRAIRNDITSHGDLPDQSCRKSGHCPVTMLLTGENQKFGQGVAENMFPEPPPKVDLADVRRSLSSFVMGTAEESTKKNPLTNTNYAPSGGLYYLQPQCKTNNGSKFVFPSRIESNETDTGAYCVQALHLWRNSSSEINNEIYKGYRKGNDERKINEIAAAFDFLNSNEKLLNVSISYNATYKKDTGKGPSPTLVSRAVNLVSNAYLQFLKGAGPKITFEFEKELPKPETRFNIDVPSILGPLFFSWVIIVLLPVMLRALVYEKENKIRIIMKMHGLGDGAYWAITYVYFLIVCVLYVTIFVILGSVLGLQFFRRNNYGIQIVFYLVYINVQISMAFFIAGLFKSVKIATVVAYMLVFGTGLLGKFLFQSFIQNPSSFPRAGILAMELYPGFALYRGLYEFSQYSYDGVYMGTDGMQWSDLSDKDNGMKEILIIMALEHFVLLGLAYYIDQVVTSGRSPIFFLQGRRQMKLSSDFETPDFDLPDDKPDVARESKTVEQLVLESSRSHSIVCANVKKTYPARDGNPEKFAVRGLSLAIPPGECFGMLGPNGAGKTTSISMMTGLTKPSSGTVYVQGLDIRSEMDLIYTSMGVCPQHNLLWETLTGREHLLFYGRLKNLAGQNLDRAVEDSLRSVNLFDGGVANKQSKKYSGGMKRRLSVAISLIGNPKVVYMDEPSTGLDPVSKNLLWDVVTNAKRDKAIILTTHSMEEAEYLCDRLGIFVDGSLQCVGNPKELKARYGGTYILTMTTSPEHEEEVEKLARELSPSATKIYHISGTQKFEMQKDGIRIADVFAAVENAKRKYTVQAWGLSDTTLEDVFIKVAKGAKSDIALT